MPADRGEAAVPRHRAARAERVPPAAPPLLPFLPGLQPRLGLALRLLETQLLVTGAPRPFATVILMYCVFGTIFAVTHRIFMVMVAHAAFDLMALAIIYWDIETDVAHFIFK